MQTYLQQDVHYPLLVFKGLLVILEVFKSLVRVKKKILHYKATLVEGEIKLQPDLQFSNNSMQNVEKAPLTIKHFSRSNYMLFHNNLK